MQTMGAYMTIILVGAAMALFPRSSPFLPRSSLQKLSQLALFVLLPALLWSTIAQSLTMEVLSEAYVVFLWSLGNMLISFVVALLLRRVVDPPGWFRRPFVVVLAFGNSGSMPLVLLEILARMEPLAKRPDALDRASTYVFIWLIAWFLVYWSVGIWYLEGMPDGVAETKVKEVAVPQRAAAGGSGATVNGFPGCGRYYTQLQTAVVFMKRLLNAPLIATIAALPVGLVAPIREAFFGDDQGDSNPPLRFISSAAQSIGKPAIGIVTLLMAASFGHFAESTRVRLRSGSGLGGSFGSIATEQHDDEGGDRKEDKEEDDEKENEMIERGKTEDDGKEETKDAEVGRRPKNALLSRTRARSSSTVSALPTRVIVWLALARMVLLPLIHIALIILFADDLLQSNDESSTNGPSAVVGASDVQLIKLVLIIEAATVSADTHVVVCSNNGHTAAAEALSGAYLLQYSMAVVTTTVSLCLAMSWIF